jgi:hypothetical protein
MTCLLSGEPKWLGAERGTLYDIDPHAGEDGFDDAAWPTIAPTALGAKRGGGRVHRRRRRDELIMSGRCERCGSCGGCPLVHVAVLPYT